MDTTAGNIAFDSDGNCNFCEDFRLKLEENSNNNENFDLLIKKIKKNGKGKKYDCIVGVSGGVDSSWVLVKVKSLGLNPLAVHMDNGWNSELAQNNIENLVKVLGVDLYTHVINWNEYKAFMNAFFDADVIDVELLYDNAMLAVNYMLAHKYNLKYILSGTNIATEGMKMPIGWNWFKYDRANIKFIGRNFRNVKPKSLPLLGTFKYVYFRFFKGILWVPFLNYFDYKKEEALNVLTDKYNFKRYLNKHYESIFTRFYQGFILPEKFKVDKRKLHFSTLIISGQMTREEALLLIEKSPYDSIDKLNSDKEYFLKKMDWTASDLDKYINRESKSHMDYNSEIKIWSFLFNIYKKAKK